MTEPSSSILTLSCPDRPGIVAAVSANLASSGFNISSSHQFSDPLSARFFMRVAFEGSEESLSDLRNHLGKAAQQFAMDWHIHGALDRPRVLLMVSRIGHCLNDLLYRQSIGALNVEIPMVVSNHETFRNLSESYGIPFIHLPVTPADKKKQESQLLTIINNNKIELVVLARYMQVLSQELCQILSGKVINIHHSFLPSFKGAKPHHQAYGRGVKLIGATAHYVTADLDEGPIIEQEVSRVDHAMGAEALMATGRDVESVVLARALQAHVERRVFLNGSKTVVFR